jgi:hypothetical protein
MHTIVIVVILMDWSLTALACGSRPQVVEVVVTGTPVVEATVAARVQATLEAMSDGAAFPPSGALRTSAESRAGNTEPPPTPPPTATATPEPYSDSDRDPSSHTYTDAVSDCHSDAAPNTHTESNIHSSAHAYTESKSADRQRGSRGGADIYAGWSWVRVRGPKRRLGDHQCPCN